MHLADGLRRHGFRKWYERELLKSHGHLALLFLWTVGILASLESASTARSTGDRLQDLLSLLLCVGAGIWSLRRYLYLLSHAEAVAHQADCPSCGTYARLRLVSASRDGGVVGVSCKQCDHHWSIES